MTEFDYELLDSGHWYKLERFGANRVERPESQADWQPRAPLEKWNAAATCIHSGRGQHDWEKRDSFVEPWIVAYGDIRMELRCSQSKNVGIFPEQEENWRLIEKALLSPSFPKGGSGRISPENLKDPSEIPLNPPLGKGEIKKVLNLFAYTGAASLVAAAAGADVCHVDASKSTVKWASHNAELSGLKDASIRWIVDDAATFLKREIKRGNRYDGIILDPPPFGHAKGKQFVFDDSITQLLSLCRQVLSEKPLFFILNSYALNLLPEEILPLVKKYIGANHSWEAGTLSLKEKGRDRALSCSVYVRFFE